LVLSSGPWTECEAKDASLAVVVSFRSRGLFRERSAVHYLRPAQPTSLLLVQTTASAPIVRARREIPQACSSVVHLENDEPVWTGTRYVIHSTLRQTPVDPSQAVTLAISIRWQGENGEGRFEQSQILNGINRAILGDSRVTASIEVVRPADVPPEAPAKLDRGAALRHFETLKSRSNTVKLVTDEPQWASALPARFAQKSTGPSGENLLLYPDHTYLYTTWADEAGEVVDDQGEWSFDTGLLTLHQKPVTGQPSRAPRDLLYLVAEASGSETSNTPRVFLVGADRALADLLTSQTAPTADATAGLVSHALMRVPATETTAACPKRDDLMAATAQFNAWNQLNERFHLAYRNGTLDKGRFILSSDASIQFADVRLFAERIEVSADFSAAKLPGPVEIEWDGQHFTTSDVTIHAANNEVRIEAEAIKTPER
jgi:hypothetical protein